MADTSNRMGSTPTAEAPPQTERRGEERRNGPPSFSTVREEDLEPHEGLRYIARLFRVLSVFLILLLIGEAVVGFVQLGTEAIPTLVVEATRLIVFAAFLWGAGDIAMMLIESNHDLRASRILLGRLNGKMQRLTDLEADDIERLAANPSLRADRSDGRTIVRRKGDGDGAR
ncbi:MAG: hypothetical protein GEU90_02200 [Gemmatimonas sp.]|nr:hypothetical protein [Gemmatimonas sp.]